MDPDLEYKIDQHKLEAKSNHKCPSCRNIETCWNIPEKHNAHICRRCGNEWDSRE